MAEPTVLMVEDNPSDVYLVTEALRKCDVAAQIVVMPDGERAIHYIEQHKDRPALIILDVNLPKKTGIEVIEAIRALPGCQEIPVIVFTSSMSIPDRSRIGALGVAAFLFKSLDLDEFNRIGPVIKQVLEQAASKSEPGHPNRG